MRERTREQTSSIMKRVARVNTAPELAFRAMLRRGGHRFRAQAKHLPGNPDFTLPAAKVAVFVHGCFWHAHGCKQDRAPQTRRAFWDAKRIRNKQRDKESQRSLRTLGWHPIVVWECQLRTPSRVSTRLQKHLSQRGRIKRR